MVMWARRWRAIGTGQGDPGLALQAEKGGVINL